MTCIARPVQVWKAIFNLHDDDAGRKEKPRIAAGFFVFPDGFGSRTS